MTRADSEDSNALGAGGEVALAADSLPVRVGLRLVVPAGCSHPGGRRAGPLARAYRSQLAGLSTRDLHRMAGGRQ